MKKITTTFEAEVEIRRLTALIETLKKELKVCKNAFRATGIMQDLNRYTDKVEELEVDWML